jgi:diaminohydroxyphosphoribosylaminopyrimidine deaminase / 5-amino-6-(5-phosphoribosylamino)uracil reductase
VVIGTLDPNPKVAGRGVKILQEAGINVIVGVLEKECKLLNKRFFIFHEQQRPYIMLKWAQTHDGYMDYIRQDVNQLPLQISNPVTRQLTHKMRAENQAIMVGTNTVMLDNPSLTVRHWSGKSPVRIALDENGIIPPDFHLLDHTVPTIIFTSQERTSIHNLEFVKIDFNTACLDNVLAEIFKRNIHSVLVEGGATLLHSFIQQDKWDEVNVEVAPIQIGSGIKAPNFPFQPITRKNIQGHEWLFYSRIT